MNFTRLLAAVDGQSSGLKIDSQSHAPPPYKSSILLTRLCTAITTTSAYYYHVYVPYPSVRQGLNAHVATTWWIFVLAFLLDCYEAHLSCNGSPFARTNYTTSCA